MDLGLHFAISLLISALSMGFVRSGRVAPMPAFILAVGLTFGLGLCKECLDPFIDSQDLLYDLAGAVFGAVIGL